jgi:16S rRNA G966 N2-methylase RsmD
MLAEAKTLEDVRQIHDLAEAARVYAKEHKLGLEAQNYAGCIAVEADIRRGEILAQMAADGERRTSGGDYLGSETVPSSPTLADLNTTKRESADAQVLAAEAATVRAWMATAKEVRPSRAARKARGARAERERQAKAKVAVPPPSCDLRLGDFREVLADIPAGSVDVVLTDPPYPAEFLPLWDDLGAFAARVLRPGGLLVAMSGQLHLPAVMALLGDHLPYRWVIAYMTPGQGPAIHARNIENHWKPVLVYGGTERWLHDVVRSDAPDKVHHDWGQSESGMAELLRLVADPGQVICDPFTGGGTTGAVALAYGCSFIGAEIDQTAYETALVRYSDKVATAVVERAITDCIDPAALRVAEAAEASERDIARRIAGTPIERLLEVAR